MILLRSIDSEFDVFDCLTRELASYFPQIDKKSLKKVIILSSFSAFLGKDLKKIANQQALLRVSGLYSYPSRKINNFIKGLAQTKPTISLKEARDNLRLVSTVKFIFANGYEGYCDGRLSTFWDGPCFVKDYFAPLGRMKDELNAMLKENLIMVSYTKSFDYLSKEALDFITGLSKGIKKIEFLGERGDVIEEVPLNIGSAQILKPSFFIGYYPRVLSKGVKSLEKRGRFKKLNLLDEDFYYAPVISSVSHSKDKGLILNNVMLKRRKDGSSSWGFFTNKRKGLDRFIKKYVYLWPLMEESFLEEIKKSAKRSRSKEKELKDFIPQELALKSVEDLGGVVEVLCGLFNRMIGEVNLRAKEGRIVLGKDFCKVFIPNLDPQIKKIFNNSSLYLDKRRVFLG